PRLLALVHEPVPFYANEVCEVLIDSADRIVFRSPAAKAAAVRVFPQFGDADVVPQGLLNSEFDRGDRRAAQTEVRQELGLPADVRIVLGCGTRELRKGFDLFVQLAARVAAQSAAPVHFVWLGGSKEATEFSGFVQHDLTLLDLTSRVSLVEEMDNPERYFL